MEPLGFFAKVYSFGIYLFYTLHTHTHTHIYNLAQQTQHLEYVHAFISDKMIVLYKTTFKNLIKFS